MADERNETEGQTQQQADAAAPAEAGAAETEAPAEAPAEGAPKAEPESGAAESAEASRPSGKGHLDLTELKDDPQAQDGTAAHGDQPTRTVRDLDAVYDIPVQVSAVLGRATMQVSQLLKLGRGAVVELDRKVGDAIDIYVNNRLVARGEVVVVEDRLGVTMTEIIKMDRT